MSAKRIHSKNARVCAGMATEYGKDGMSKGKETTKALSPCVFYVCQYWPQPRWLGAPSSAYSSSNQHQQQREQRNIKHFRAPDNANSSNTPLQIIVGRGGESTVRDTLQCQNKQTEDVLPAFGPSPSLSYIPRGYKNPSTSLPPPPLASPNPAP